MIKKKGYCNKIMNRKGILALNTHGDLTYCTASEENRGKGRCNHLFHKRNDESEQDFLNRISKFNFININDLDGVNSINAPSSIGGAQTKWWNKNNTILYKQDVDDPSRGLVQWNGLSEDLISKFMNELNVYNFAKYETVYINGKIGCSSENFIKKDEHLIEFSEILKDEDMEYLTNIDNENFDDKFRYLCNKIKDKTNNQYDPSDDLIKLIKLDIITMNADRHYGNIALIYNKKDNKFKFSTIYDNGQCLLSENIYKDIDAYGENKFNLPGLSMFGMFPMKKYIKFALKHSNKNNNITIDLDKAEDFIDNYKNNYYNEDKVEKVKWLLWDNIDLYNELGLINNEGEND